MEEFTARMAHYNSCCNNYGLPGVMSYTAQDMCDEFKKEIMEELIKKLKDERKHEAGKLSNLEGFLAGEGVKKLTEYHQSLLKRQKFTMRNFVEVLDLRIRDLEEAL